MSAERASGDQQSSPTSPSGRFGTVRIVAAVGAAFYGIFGLWAFVHPSSFYERIASFPPYNVHLIHDLGAFQAGIAATLVAALIRRDSLLAALAGTSVAGVLHFVAHVMDRNLGGRATDPISIGIIGAVVVLAAVARSRQAPSRNGAAATEGPRPHSRGQLSEHDRDP